MTEIASQNRTTVRPIRSRQTGRIRAAFALLERVAPGMGARWAERLWFTVPRVPVAARRRDHLPVGELVDVSVHGRRVVAEAWGEGPAVYLMHGWGGWRTQLGAFVEPLVAAGWRVVAVDGPSHGDSDPGAYGPRQSTLVELADALVAAENGLGPAHAVIAHSGGASAVALALRAGLTPRRLVFVAPMAHPADYLETFAGFLGIGARTRKRLVPRIVSRVGVPLSDLDIPAVATHLGTPSLLVVHDREDAETPWSGGDAIARAWPDARLISTTGLGHRRIVRDPDVVRHVTTFLGPVGAVT